MSAVDIRPRIYESMFDVPPLRFYDQRSKREMMYVYPHTKHWCAGWILFKTESGHWVTLRRATDDDVDLISAAVIAAHHA